MLKKENRFHGFTLIEIVVVLLILAVMAAFIVPSYVGYLENAKITLDKVSLAQLNKFTKYYKIGKDISVGDIFAGINTDDARMQKLIDGKYLDDIVKPEVKGASFNWDVTSQKWIYNLTAGINYLFSTQNPNDYIKTSSWTSGANGFYSENGMLFIENKKSAYTITNKATLGSGKYTDGTSGGYGILFETSLSSSNQDSGYVLQFDRGLGGIVIRKRESGIEKTPLIQVKYSNNNLIPASKRDVWWTEEREIKLQVDTVSGQNGKKKITVFIDNVMVIDNFMFDSSVDATNNYTGFRSWDAGTSYSEMMIE